VALLWGCRMDKERERERVPGMLAKLLVALMWQEN
jgi:hypothetical protein